MGGEEGEDGGGDKQPRLVKWTGKTLSTFFGMYPPTCPNPGSQVLNFRVHNPEVVFSFM